MGFPLRPSVICHAIHYDGDSMVWPSALTDLTAALPKPGQIHPILSEEHREGIKFLVSNLQAALQRECQLRLSPNPKTCFLILLVRVIFLSSMPKSLIWESAQITLPMHPHAHAEPLAQYLPRTTTASLLLLSQASGLTFPPTPPSSLPESTSTSDGYENEISSSAAASNAETSYPTSHPQSQAPNPLDDFALEAHVLSRPDDLSKPLVCLFCMADTENISDAIASALHQRRVWGIHQPIVGLAFDPSYTTVQVAFGWFEASECDGATSKYATPSLHTAYAAPDANAGEAGGVFDLKSIRSAELLASFLIAIQEDMMLVQSRCQCESTARHVSEKIRCGTISRWRSDGAGSELTAEEEERAWKEHIEKWIQGVDFAHDGEDSPCATERSCPMDGSECASEETWLSRHLSPSHHDPHKDGNHLTNMWLLDRRALTYSLLPARTMSKLRTEEPQTDAVHIQASLPHFRVYDDMTAFFYPAEWDRKRPSVPEHLQCLLDELLEEKSLREEDVAAGRLPETRDLETSSWLMDVLNTRIVDVLQIVAGTRLLVGPRCISGISELDWQFSWEMLARLFFVGPTTAYMAEPTINLPRAEDPIPGIGSPEDYEQTLTETPVDVIYRKAVIEECLLAQDDFIRARNAYSKDQSACKKRAKQDAEAQFDVTRIVARTCGDVFRAWEQRRQDQTREDRLKYDPMTARCDGLGSLQITSFPPRDARIKGNKVALLSPTLKRVLPHEAGSIEKILDRTFDPRRTDCVRGTIFPNGTSHPKTSCIRSLPPAQSLVSSFFLGDLSPGISDFTQINPEPNTQNAHLSGSEDVGDVADTDPGAEDTLHIPILFHEYQESVRTSKETAVNRWRIDAVASVKFLATLGITDFPVFGLVTKGPVGVVVCAWGMRDDSDSGIDVQIIDRLGREFDISTVNGAFNYATFVSKLSRDHAPRLSCQFTDRERAINELKDGESLKYTRNMHQLIPK